MGTSATWLPIILAVAAISVPALYLLPDGAEAAGEVTVSVVLDGEKTIQVDVGPGTDGVITFTGTVTATQPVDVQAQLAIVELVVNSGTFQSTEIAPIIIYDQGREARFAFSIQVPPGYESTTVLGDMVLSIGGTWRYEPGGESGSVTEVEFIVDIDPFYLYKISSPQQYVQTSPGGEFDVELRVRNEGNSNDRIQIDLLNREALDKAGWSVQYDVSAFELPYNEEKGIKLHVTTPVEWKGYKNTVTPIRFAVTSTYSAIGHDLSEQVTYTIYVRERGVAVPGFDVPLVVLALLAVAGAQFARKRS
jgi:hypothetical protein